MENKDVVAVFDADDTLWMNEGQYSQAVCRFFDYLYQALRNRVPTRGYLSERFQKIDGELFGTWGVKRGRLAKSMVRLYYEVLGWAKWRYGVNLHDKRDERFIREIGDLPFDYELLDWLPEAKALLEKLKKAGWKLCLLTSYDNKVFPKRAKYMGLKEFFHPENTLAVEYKKTKEDFIAVSGWSPQSDKNQKWVAVGNADSDILPALDISENWYGVRVPHGSSSKYCEDKDSGKYTDCPYPYFMPPPLVHPRALDLRSLSDFPKAMELIRPAG